MCKLFNLKKFWKAERFELNLTKFCKIETKFVNFDNVLKILKIILIILKNFKKVWKNKEITLQFLNIFYTKVLRKFGKNFRQIIPI